MNDGLEMGFWDREYSSEEELAKTQSALENGVENNLTSFDLDSFDEDIYEDIIEEEEDEVSIVNTARIRLEQGRLYEMLIKHDLFEGVDAMPEAIDNVQKEIKTFIMERLEILLGMRAEKEIQNQQVIQASQFNEMEVQALKQVASRLTKGASVNVETNIVKNELNTVKKQNKEIKINKLNYKTAKNNKRKKITVPKKEQIQISKASTKNKNPEQIAKKDIDYLENLKGKTLEEANAMVSQRHRRPIPKTNMNQESINSYYTSKVAVQDSKLSDFGKLMKMAALKKAQQ